jgi:hypothetical protein
MRPEDWTGVVEERTNTTMSDARGPFAYAESARSVEHRLVVDGARVVWSRDGSDEVFVWGGGWATEHSVAGARLVLEASGEAGEAEGPEGDADADGWSDADEERLGTDPFHPLSRPMDLDGDGVADPEDADRDGDGWQDPSDASPYFDDNAREGGNLCDDSDADLDGDGVPDGRDADVDGDGVANFEDPDDDGDGTPDAEDADPCRPGGKGIPGVGLVGVAVLVAVLVVVRRRAWA